MLKPEYKTKEVKVENGGVLLSVKQYADQRRISTQAVYNAIHNGHKLSNVKEVHKLGNVVLLEVETDTQTPPL